MIAPAASSEPPGRPAPTDDTADDTALEDLLSSVRAGVDSRLAQVVVEQRQRWEHAGPAAAELLDAAQSLLDGGKRMRAVLAAVGLRLGPKAPASAAMALPSRVGAALELYQASALAHDDVIDAADLRRGRPTAHRHLAAVHRQRRWRGDRQDFGAAGAILLGDLLLSLAGQELGEALSSADQRQAQAARRTFDEMTAEVAVGQFLDVRSEALPLPGPQSDPQAAARQMEAAAVQVVRAKSARYSVMYPLRLGAVLGGVPAHGPLYTALEVFGEQVGIAFQLRDDVLGVLGAQEHTGKPVGDDLREGKRTVLLALTWNRVDEEGRDLLRSVLANRRATSEQIEACTRLITACGALEEHDSRIAGHLHRAGQALDEVVPDLLSPERRGELDALAHLLTDRVA